MGEGTGLIGIFTKIIRKINAQSSKAETFPVIPWFCSRLPYKARLLPADGLFAFQAHSSAKAPGEVPVNLRKAQLKVALELNPQLSARPRKLR